MYKTKDKEIVYTWNNLYSEKIMDLKNIEKEMMIDLIKKIHTEEQYYHISCIDKGIFEATTEYFKKIWSHRCNLPLTTLMISSPWEVYAGQTIDYTTDTLPIEIPWRFESKKRIFLSESSQFYLELTLLIKNIDSVFSIYNSFRKEKSDATHLSEFQHIEYEWKTDLLWCKKILLWLIEFIFNYLYKNHKENLLYFISEKKLLEKKKNIENWPIKIDFKDAIDLLYRDTKDPIYKEFSLKHFWPREEIRLTELLWWNVLIEKFPMLQIPFYHAIADEEYNGVPLAKNVDLILYGYRETIGAGERIRSKDVLLKKAEIFNLPRQDYLPYTQSRDFEDYCTTSGFGLWWQRLVHWLTDQPTIYQSTIIPRTHLFPNP